MIISNSTASCPLRIQHYIAFPLRLVNELLCALNTNNRKTESGRRTRGVCIRNVGGQNARLFQSRSLVPPDML